MNLKNFYENHVNFSARTDLDYYISPGIRCKFDIIKDKIKNLERFEVGVDLGSSGDSILTQIYEIRNKSYLDIANTPLRQFRKISNPICGDLQSLPYQNDTFDIVFALDVLEHINKDEVAIIEISRILKKKGLAIITVPHRMKYFTQQDRIIGHLRRYEIKEITKMFKKANLRLVNFFGIYGRLMKISYFQTINPQLTEEKILKLRKKFMSDSNFRIIWNLIVILMSKLMKIDAMYTPTNKIMNMGFIFIKE
jgi:SAM-dependent methyltransferase